MKRPNLSSWCVGREALLIFGLLALVRLPLLTGELNLFDRYSIEKDAVLSARAGYAEAFYFGSPMLSPEARFRPLTTMSLAADLAMNKGGMLVVRLANILLQLGLLLLFLRLLKRFGVTTLPAALALALVWLHPMQVSVIASLDGRAPLLGGVAFLLALDLVSHETLPRRREILAFAFALMGSLCSLQLLPLAILPVVAAYAHRRDLKASWRRARSLVIGGAIGLFLALFFLGHWGMAAAGRAVDGEGMSGVLRSSLAVIGSSYGRMLGSWRFPAADSPMPGAGHLGLPFALLGFFMLAATLLLGLRARQRNRGLTALGFLMMPLMILPLTPLCGNGPVPTPAEFTPVLMMFAFPLASFLMVPLLAPSPKKRLVLSLILLSLGLVSILRAWPYRQADLVVLGTVGDGPLAAIAQATEAGERAEGAVPARAIEREQIEAALARFPGEPRLLVERMRLELRPSGQPKLADAALTKLLADDRAIAGRTGMAGALAAAQGDYNAARALWQKGWAEDPLDAYSAYSLAQIDMRSGAMSAARAKLLQALPRLRGPAEQGLAVKVLHQLDYLRQRGDMDPSTLRALAQEQERFLARPEDQRALHALMERLDRDAAKP